MSDPRFRRPPISRMSALALLAEYSSAQRWFGDDFCISQPKDKDFKRADRVEAEILRRMEKAA